MAKKRLLRKLPKQTDENKKLPPPPVSYGCTAKDYDMTNHVMVAPGVFKPTPEYHAKLKRQQDKLIFPEHKNPTKETTMATKKKSPAKKSVAKKSATKPKTKAKKAAPKSKAKPEETEEESDGTTFKQRVLEMMQSGEFTDQMIVDQLSEEFDDMDSKHIQRNVTWYRWDWNKKNPKNQIVKMVEGENGKLVEYVKGGKRDSVPTKKSKAKSADKKPTKKSTTKSKKSAEKATPKKTEKKPAKKAAPKKSAPKKTVKKKVAKKK